MRAPLPHQLPYRADIDGLRAIAVLLVVAFHAYPQSFPGGFIGVDVFFVISGFLISSLIFDAQHEGRFRFADFYARRIRRIFPALLLVLAASFAAGWALLLPGQFRDFNRLVLSGVFFVPNLTLWSETGYFAGDPEQTPLLHLWSLGVEEQFYLGWPLLAVLFWKRGLTAVIAGLSLLSFVSGVMLIRAHPNAVFYLPVTRLWELMAGAFLAFRERRHLRSDLGAAMKSPAAWRGALSVLGLGVLALCGVMMNSALPFPGWWALPPVLGTMMVVAAGPRARFNRRVLAQPMLVGVGLISYPLYLWHWPILSFLKIGFHEGVPENIKTRAILAAFVLAWATYRFVEKPIRGARLAAQRRRWVIALICAGLVVAAIAGLAVWDKGVPQRYPATIASFLTFDYASRSNKPWRDQICFLMPTDPASAWKDDCIDRPNGKPLVMLWGDSHAAHLIPGLESLQATRAFRLGRMTGAGCPPVFDFALPDHPACPAENDLFFSQITARKPQIVILAAAWDSYRYGGAEAKIARLDDTDIFRRVARTIDRLRGAGVAHIVLVGPAPLWNGNLPDILISAALAQGHVPAALGPEWRQDNDIVRLDADMKAYAARHSISYVSLNDAICRAGQCRTLAGTGPEAVTVFDGSHFTAAGSRDVAARLADQLLPGLSIGHR